MKQNPTNDKMIRDGAMEHHLFSDTYSYFGEYNVPTRMTLTFYNEQELETCEVPVDTDNFRQLARKDCMNWFRITGMADSAAITRLLTQFGIPMIDVKPVLTPCHAAKIDLFDKRLIIVMKSCFFENSHKVASEHICIVSKDNVVFTFKEREEISYDNVMKGLENNTMNIRKEKNSMLVAFILNSVISVMIGTAKKVEETLEKIDDILINAHHSRSTIGMRLQECRHANLILQKNSKPLHDEFFKLVKSSTIQQEKSLLPVYNELYNQLDFVVLTAENCKEMLASLRDLYVSSNELRMNEVVKRLTVLATLFIPITFLVGLWGMNFKNMPETEWEYGYLIAWVMILGTAYGTWQYMKRNKWF